MSYYLAAMLVGILLAFFNNIADILTITNFETVNGPIICIPKDNLENALHHNNRLRNMLLSVTYTDTSGNKQLSYLQTPVNFMSMSSSSQRSLLIKALRRNSSRPSGLIKFTALH